MERVLVVDDEEGIRTFLAEVLEEEGYKVTLAEDGDAAARLLATRSFHLMITDLRMPGMDGMSLVRLARTEAPEMEVIVLTAYGTVATAVEAMRLGAFDYITKPISGPDELRLLVARALERRRLREESQSRRSGEDPEPVAVDPTMKALLERVHKVAPTDATVLLLGESGTGKDVVARAIHRWSRRKEGPFVAVNCAALASSLLESELFGHEKGAFTGATASRRGRFELADGGTLFLDEIGELEAPLQAKLLRVLEDRRFERVGGMRTIEVDIRLIAATNRDLRAAIAEGRFREDLYHRLAVFPVTLPPLRSRPGDILPLAEVLLTRIGLKLGKLGLRLTDGAKSRLLEYSWPGNVRELENVLERAAILGTSGEIDVDDLGIEDSPSASRSGLPGVPLDGLFTGTLRDIEREAIRRALVATGGHRKKTANLLGIGLRTLYDKLKEYGLE